MATRNAGLRAARRRWIKTLKWRRRNPHIFTVLLLFSVTAIVMWFNWYHVPARVVQAFESQGYTFTETLELQGAYGDIFGSINALFSGIAMIAAISAIVLQSFEFSAQREELALQRREMATANVVNEKRFKLDEAVYNHSRTLYFLERSRTFQSKEIASLVRGVVVLKFSKFGLRRTFVCAYGNCSAFNDEKWNPNDVNTSVARLKEAEPAFDILFEIAYASPTDEELMAAFIVIEETRFLLRPMLEAAEEFGIEPPRWLMAGKSLLERVDNIAANFGNSP